MDRPLWQIILSIMVLSLALRNAAAGVAWHMPSGNTAVVIAYVLQGLVGVWVWASILWLRRTLRASIWAYAIAVAVTAALKGFVFRVEPQTTSMIQIMMAFAISAIAVYALRRSTTADG